MIYIGVYVILQEILTWLCSVRGCRLAVSGKGLLSTQCCCCFSRVCALAHSEFRLQSVETVRVIESKWLHAKHNTRTFV